jgi:hypothetical protein
MSSTAVTQRRLLATIQNHRSCNCSSPKTGVLLKSSINNYFAKLKGTIMAYRMYAHADADADMRIKHQ